MKTEIMRSCSVLVALALCGCSITPPLVAPELPVPSVYPTNGDSPAPSHVAQTGVHLLYDDQRLQALIDEALNNNRDLRLATMNVAAVQAQFHIQRSARLPNFEATAVSMRAHTTSADGESGLAAPSQQTQHTISLGLSAFELDLFGRVQALSEAAFARYVASEYGRRSVQIALVSAVADAYFAERLATEQLQLAEQTLDDWRQSLQLARQLKAAEQNSGLDVAQAEGQVASAEADLEARQRAVARTRNALDFIVGAESLPSLPQASSLQDLSLQMQLPAGLPSDLLIRRPDLLQAEQNLIAANADIGAARAAFFPRLSLTASLGSASPAIGNLFEGQNRVWQFTPQITQPLFQSGRLRAELRLARIRKSVAIAEYELAIQTAFREVADALAGQATYGNQIRAQSQVVASAARRLELATLRYRAGLEGRLELLDAQRQLYSARQTLLDVRREELLNAVNLYKALGGDVTQADVK